jgi:hypothetical protein
MCITGSQLKTSNIKRQWQISFSQYCGLELCRMKLHNFTFREKSDVGYAWIQQRISWKVVCGNCGCWLELYSIDLGFVEPWRKVLWGMSVQLVVQQNNFRIAVIVTHLCYRLGSVRVYEITHTHARTRALSLSLCHEALCMVFYYSKNSPFEPARNRYRSFSLLWPKYQVLEKCRNSWQNAFS